MKPYYQNGPITLYHADCREVTLPTFNALITDPPYGESMGYDGDEPNQSDALLNHALAVSVDKMPRMGHAAIFWTMRNLDQPIDAVRSHGLVYRRTLSMYLPKGGARPYRAWLPRVQPIVLAQKYLPCQPTEFHTRLAEHVAQRIEASGKKKTEIARELGCDSRLVMKWSRVGDPAWCLPTPRFYPRLKAMLALSDDFDMLLDRPLANKESRDYQYKHDCYVVDEERRTDFGHPSEKPLSVMRHLVNSLTLPGETVADLFAGSGSTLEAAILEGRKAVGCEIDERYCEVIAKRCDAAFNVLREALA